MTIATKLKAYLDQHQTEYRTIKHMQTASSMETAEMARVPGDRLAKGVILKDENGVLMVVLPSDYHVDIDVLSTRTGRALAFAEEEAVTALFPDCKPGAVPPVGPAYGVETIWDTRLGSEDTVYVEAGDHQTLLEMSGRAFHELMAPAERGHFSQHI